MHQFRISTRLLILNSMLPALLSTIEVIGLKRGLVISSAQRLAIEAANMALAQSDLALHVELQDKNKVMQFVACQCESPIYA